MNEEKKIRVAFILSSLGYITRGSEVAFTAYIRELVKNEDLEIIVFSAGKNFSIEGARHVRIPSIMREWFKKFPKFRRLYLKHDYDYEVAFFSILLTPVLLWYRIDIAMCTCFPFDLLPLKVYRWLRNRKMKVVYNSGGGTAFSHSKYFFADAVTATDPYSQALFADKYNAYCIPPGVDPALFEPRPHARTELRLPTDAFVIFSSSAHDPVKRLDALIHAASNIENAYIIFASNGIQRNYLEKLGTELFGNRICFVGFVDRHTLDNLYAAADVFCLPSKTEPFGLVLIESMASGTPVVTNNTDIQQWIVRDGGSCIDVMDESTLSAELEKYKDPAYRQAVSERARINARRFSWEAAADSYHQLFLELTGK